MKNKKALFIILTITLILIGLIGFAIINKLDKKDKKRDTPIPTVSQIELNTKQYINQLEKVKINGTDDTIMITEKVKWEVPDYGKGVTVSFAIAIPYTITVNGKDYDGIYELNDFSLSTLDNNPKYNFKVTNLTKNGDIEVLITSK